MFHKGLGVVSYGDGFNSLSIGLYCLSYVCFLYWFHITLGL